ncbi:MAG: DUF6624 domain-containing protein [Candidatus Kapaibacterium sp.]
MKTKVFALTVLFIVLINTVYSQNITSSSLADSLQKEGNLKGAIEEFRRGFYSNSSDKRFVFDYACALAQDRQKDSAFKYIYIAISLDTAVYTLTDPDFLTIREDKRWIDFEETLISMLKIKYKNYYNDIELAKQLWKMRAVDQAYYEEIMLAQKKIGMFSTVEFALWEFKKSLNETNLKNLEDIIETKGWPKISDVGENAAGGAFLIIQHSNYEKQKKYLPTIKALCEIKEANWESYALMYDRIQMNENKPQRYGSQVTFNNSTKSFELYQLEDESKVDEWRKEMGLIPLSEYVAIWGLKFIPKK